MEYTDFNDLPMTFMVEEMAKIFRVGRNSA